MHWIDPDRAPDPIERWSRLKITSTGESIMCKSRMLKYPIIPLRFGVRLS